MPSRSYAQIECSLTSSRRIRSLPDHKTKWAYLCAHLSDFATYTGLFQYPKHMWAHDAELTIDELDTAIDALVSERLIDFDQNEQFVRIIDWFHKCSGPNNRNRIVSIINDLRILEDVPETMLCGSVAELTSASLKRAQRWKQDSSARELLYSDLKTFLLEVYQDHREMFLDTIRQEMEQTSTSIRQEIGAVFPHVLYAKQEPLGNPSERVAEHETKTRRDQDETQTKTKRNLNEDGVSQFSVSAHEHTDHLTSNVELLGKRRGATNAALQSTLAQAARGTK